MDHLPLACEDDMEATDCPPNISQIKTEKNLTSNIYVYEKNIVPCYISGPGCSKLTMSLVNVS